jgi:hypothetical protein
MRGTVYRSQVLYWQKIDKKIPVRDTQQKSDLEKGAGQKKLTRSGGRGKYKRPPENKIKREYEKQKKLNKYGAA